MINLGRIGWPVYVEGGFMRTAQMTVIDSDRNGRLCFICLNNLSRKDWVACVCGRWLHEDCTDDCVIDSDRNGRLCFICLNNL